MARSEYVIRRLAELGLRPKPQRAPRDQHKPRRPRNAKYLPIPRGETIDRIGALYVRKLRNSYEDRRATWFDVAEAYARGWKDAECIIPGHRPATS